MSSFDGKAMAADVLKAVRDFVARSMVPLQAKIDDLEQRVTRVRDDLNAELPNVVRAIEAIPKPKDADPVDYERIATEVKALVDDAASKIQVPKDGQDVDMDAVQATIAEQIRQAFEAMPKPKDGTSVTADDLLPLIRDTIALIPKPKDGDPGKDAPPIDRDSLRDEILAWMPKPKDGQSVPVEQVQKMVDDAVLMAVSAIRIPKDGNPGRDAAHLEILPAMDEAKSYPRGTYTKHANGFWRAFEQTHGMRGWECLVSGIAAVEITSDHEREFAIKAVMSDGTISMQVFKLPVCIYRGVFVEGKQYEQGDQVSWGAHQWHCNEPTTEKPIEGGKAWTLSVKRGRAGKDGADGKDWTPPKPVAINAK